MFTITIIFVLYILPSWALFSDFLAFCISSLLNGLQIHILHLSFQRCVCSSCSCSSPNISPLWKMIMMLPYKKTHPRLSDDKLKCCCQTSISTPGPVLTKNWTILVVQQQRVSSWGWLGRLKAHDWWMMSPFLLSLSLPYWFLGQEYPLEEGMAIYSSIAAWRIPWTEEPGGL